MNPVTQLIYSFILTLSVHESLQVAAPVSWLWLGHVHAIKVEVGHGIVFGVTSHIDNLFKEITDITQQASSLMNNSLTRVSSFTQLSAAQQLGANFALKVSSGTAQLWWAAVI